MHIVLIHLHSDPFAVPGARAVGGQNVYVANLANALAKFGYEITVLTRRECKHSPICTVRGKLRVIRIDCGVQNIVKENMFEFLPDFAIQATKLLKHKNVDIIYSNYWLEGWVGLYLKEQLGCPLIHSYHSLGLAKFSHTNSKLTNFVEERLLIEKKLSETADKLFVSSNEEKKLLINCFSKKIAKKIAIISPIINANIFFTKSFAMRDDQINLILVGRPDKNSALQETINAVVNLNHKMKVLIQLTIIGDFNHQDYSSTDNYIHWTGRIKNSLLGNYYRKSDFTIVPSLYENFGLVAAESLMCGTPVIASKVGGLIDIINHKKNGYLINVKDDVTFQLETILYEYIHMSHKKRATLRLAAANTLKNLSTTKTIKKINHIVQKLYFDKNQKSKF